VWANMYSDPFSSTTPAAAGIDNPDYVKRKETLPSQEESAERDIPTAQLVTKVQPIPLGVKFSKAQSSKLERLFCHVSVQRDNRAWSFEL